MAIPLTANLDTATVKTMASISAATSARRFFATFHSPSITALEHAHATAMTVTATTDGRAPAGAFCTGGAGGEEHPKTQTKDGFSKRALPRFRP